MPEKKWKAITIRESTKGKLEQNRLKKNNETYDEEIIRLIAFYRKHFKLTVKQKKAQGPREILKVPIPQ